MFLKALVAPMELRGRALGGCWQYLGGTLGVLGGGPDQAKSRCQAPRKLLGWPRWSLGASRELQAPKAAPEDPSKMYWGVLGSLWGSLQRPCPRLGASAELQESPKPPQNIPAGVLGRFLEALGTSRSIPEHLRAPPDPFKSGLAVEIQERYVFERLEMVSWRQQSFTGILGGPGGWLAAWGSLEAALGVQGRSLEVIGGGLGGP